MGILGNAIEKRSSTLSKPSKRLLEAFGINTRKSTAGVDVNEKNILSVTAVFCAVKILSETMASLPLIYYRILDNDDKERAKDRDLYHTLKLNPNPETTSFDFRRAVTYHYALKGNGFAWIERDRVGRPKNLWQLNSDQVQIERRNNQIHYRYYKKEANTPKQLDQSNIPYILIPQKNMLHISGMSRNGIVGLSLIQQVLVETMGIARASQQFAARWFANNASNGAIIEHPKQISEPAQERLKEQLREEYSGLSNAHKLKVLEEGMELKELGNSPEESQLLESRQFTTAEASRIWRIPPHMLANLENANYSNIEKQSQEFVKYTMLPHFKNWEQEMDSKLITEENRGKYTTEFLATALLRGDSEARSKYYKTAIEYGWMNRNEVRQKENMNSIEGGDTYLRPLNLISSTAESPKKKDNNDSNDTSTNSRRSESRDGLEARKQLKDSYERIVREQISKLIRLEANEINDAAEKYFGKRDSRKFLNWLEEFYFEKLPEKADGKMRGVVGEMADAIANIEEDEIGEKWGKQNRDLFVQQFTNNFIKKHSAKNRKEIEKVVSDALDQDIDVQKEVKKQTEHWEEERIESESRDTATEIESAVTRDVAVANGYRVVWDNRGDTCPMCKTLDGKTVSANSAFLDANNPIAAEGSKVMRKSQIHHPPLHNGCDCGVRHTI